MAPILAVTVSDRDIATGGARRIVDGWRIAVTLLDSCRLIAAAPGVLSAEEHTRFNAMRHRDAAEARRCAHVFKRQCLAAHLGLAPAAVGFARDTAGPRLLPPHSDTHVSLSHAPDAVAVAMAATPVGIDIERIERADDPVRLAARYFANDEAHAIAEAPAVDQPFAFAWRWVAKEALLKACDLKLSVALATSLGAAPRERDDLPCTLHVGGAPITIFAPADGYVCAVARG